MSLIDELRKKIGQYEADRKEDSESLKALQSELQRVEHHHVMPRNGIDYAFPPHPPADKLHSAGFSFVGRYLTDPANSGKGLTFGEAHELSHNGIDIFVFFEEEGRELEGGYNVGVRVAHKAINALNALHPKGQPPIYFVCDFDAHGEGKTNDVLEAIRGAVHTIGWHRVGLYAGYDVVLAAANEHRCKFLCQTLAWSGGKWLPEAQLRQLGEIKLFGASCDIDHALAADFGQFKV